MSVDPNTLERGDKVRFGRQIIREVTSIELGSERYCVLDEDVSLGPNDPFWELAELARPELPDELHSGYLCGDLSYYSNGHYNAPEKLLKFLKQDVAALEAAGVKESD